jgi:hypothetical protein
MPHERNRYITAMGEELGAYFYDLTREVILLYTKWTEFVELFGTKPSRVDLLNAAAPEFFHLLDCILWNDMLIHLARLTDRRTRHTLTIQKLPRLVSKAAEQTVHSLVGIACDKAKFCLDPRNKLLAHTARELAAESKIASLTLGSREQMREALASIAAALCEVHRHYLHQEMRFDDRPRGWALALLRVVHLGVEARTDKRSRAWSYWPDL